MIPKNEPDALSASELRNAALRLHERLERFVDPDGGLRGPDSGTRINLRIGRFVKSCLRFIPWRDDRYYAQAQTYWIQSLLRLRTLTGSPQYGEAAIRCSELLLRRQTPQGYWELSNPEWKGRITTVEAAFGGIGLLEAYLETGNAAYLEGARKAYKHLVESAGFLDYDDSICIQYFSNRYAGLVPNNSTLALWFFAMLASVTKDDSYLRYCPGMVRFLRKCQLDSGELPYALQTQAGIDKLHYLCYQYNAFEFLDLCYYYRLTGDEEVLSVMESLSAFLSRGLTVLGDAKFNCLKAVPTMNYFTAAIAAALLEAHAMNFGDYLTIAERGFTRLLRRQRPDGGFDYSNGDYRLLSDRRLYPRNLSMQLRHLLIASENELLRARE